MSEEENIAIKTLKEVASDNFDTLGDDISPKMAQNILNVINKQQKEIKELKNNELDYTTIYINGVYEGKKYYKDKIREKIKELEKETGKGCYIRGEKILVLQELLEEK